MCVHNVFLRFLFLVLFLHRNFPNEEATDNDVILGRGKQGLRQIRNANQEFTKLVEDTAHSYQSAKKNEKNGIATILVNTMKAKNFRFVQAKFDGMTGKHIVTKVLTEDEAVSRTKRQLCVFAVAAPIVNPTPVATAATSTAIAHPQTDPLGFFQQLVKQGSDNINMSGVHNEHVDKYIGVSQDKYIGVSHETHTHHHINDNTSTLQAFKDFDKKFESFRSTRFPAQ